MSATDTSGGAATEEQPAVIEDDAQEQQRKQELEDWIQAQGGMPEPPEDEDATRGVTFGSAATMIAEARKHQGYREKGDNDTIFTRWLGPIQGYGSGSFQDAYRDHRENKDVPVSVSHTEPVTVAAEQGLLGLVLYFALIVVALWTMLGGVRARLAGADGESENGASLPRPQDSPSVAAPAAILAAFVALLVHTLSYAGFFEDPITWVLLAIGASLAHAPVVRDPA